MRRFTCPRFRNKMKALRQGNTEDAGWKRTRSGWRRIPKPNRYRLELTCEGKGNCKGKPFIIEVLAPSRALALRRMKIATRKAA